MHICPRELLVASDFGYRWETRRYLPAYLEMMDLAQYFIVCGENSAAGLVGIEMDEQVSDTHPVYCRGYHRLRSAIYLKAECCLSPHVSFALLPTVSP